MRTVALCGRDDTAYPAEQAAVARREGERRRPTCRPVALAAASSSPIADCLIALYAKKASGAAAEGVLESAARAEARKCGLEGRQQQVYRDNSKLCLQVAPCVRLQPELEEEDRNTTLTNNETLAHKTSTQVSAALLIRPASSQPPAPHKPSAHLDRFPPRHSQVSQPRTHTSHSYPSKNEHTAAHTWWSYHPQ